MRAGKIGFALLLLASLAFAADWPTFQGHAARSGYIPERTRAPLAVSWGMRMGPPSGASYQGMVLGSPVVVGNIVVAASSTLGVWAFDRATGAKLWGFSGATPTSPPTAGNGAVVFGAGQDVYCLNLNTGGLLWSYDTTNAGNTFSGVKGGQVVYPALILNGIAYVPVGNSYVYIFNISDGTLMQVYQGLSGIVLSNGTLLYVYQPGGSEIHAFDPSGAGKWQVSMPAPIHWVLVGPGAIYCLREDGAVSALDPSTGQRIWESALSDVAHWACLGPRLFVAGPIGLAALDPSTGAVLGTASEVKSPLAPVNSGGNLFLLQGGCLLTALDAGNFSVLWKYLLPQAASAPSAIALTGREVFIHHGDGALYAFSMDAGDAVPPAFDPNSLQPAYGAILKGDPPIDFSVSVSDFGSGVRGDTLKFKLDGVLRPATYDDLTGRISYTYQPSPPRRLPDGQHTVEVSIRDWFGNEGRISWAFTTDSTPPTAVIRMPARNQRVGTKVPIIGTATDNLSFKEFVVEYGAGPSPLAWTRVGSVHTSPVRDGLLEVWDTSALPDGEVYTVRLRVTDQAGNVGAATATVIIDHSYPVALITKPAGGEVLTGRVEIEGTAYSPKLKEWTLEYGKGRYPVAWSTIVRKDQPVQDGLLASWDTSSLPDGTYTLRLTVRDKDGREAEAAVTVSLDNTYPSIVGTVTDAETGEPLAGAVVEALGPEGFRGVAYTDSAGNYVLHNLKPARYTLRASALGYKDAEQTLQIAMKPDEWRADFALEKAPPKRPGAISGLVYVSVSREPLGNVEVTVSFGGRVVARTTTSPEATTEAGYRFNYRIEGLEPARYEVSVSLPGFTPVPESQTVEVKEGEETKGVNFSMRPFHYIGRGLHMVSVPYDYSRVAPDPAELLRVSPASLKLAKWEASLSKYAFYPDPPADRFRIGEGYWLYLDEPVSITVEGISASSAQPYPILLRTGWNMIGDPFTFAVDWYACRVVADGETMSVEEAMRRGVLGSGLWTYEFGTYRLAFTLEPWKGYWVRAFKNCTLLVSNEPISGRAPVRVLKAGATDGGWAVRVSVEAAGTRDDENLLGLLEGAGAGYDPTLDVLEPPAVGLKPQVRAYFESPAGPLAIDVKGGRRAEWTLAIEIPPGAKEVRITWDGLKSLPRGTSLVLEDPVAGRAVFMRTSSSYAFEPRKGERVRRLRIRATEWGARLGVADIKATRLKGGGGILVRFLLTAPAEVEARLLTPLGREVARGARATASPGWNGALLRGRSIPPGIYVVEVRAKGEDGREARASRPVLLR